MGRSAEGTNNCSLGSSYSSNVPWALNILLAAICTKQQIPCEVVLGSSSTRAQFKERPS